MEGLHREAVYLWYYFDIQLRQILPYWVLGIVLGSLVSVFAKDHIHGLFRSIGNKKLGIIRNIKATGLWFLLGIILSAVFQRYVPVDVISGLFGENEGFGVLMAATIGVPLYACGGGTIPLLIQWLADGMSMGSAAAFMITGPSTKITNLGAVKIVLGVKHFIFYLVFVMLFSLILGWVVNWL